MIIVQVTDTHIAPPSAADGGPAAWRAGTLRRCVAAVNRLEPRPDAVVHTGDLTQNGSPAACAHVRALLAPLTAPVYVVPGNRDRRDALRLAFGRDGYLPREGAFLHYTVEHHPVRLVALDSVAIGRGHGSVCAERRDWLEAALAAAPDRPTVILLHHPPFDGHYGGLAGLFRAEEATAMAAILERHRQVRRVLCGHAHLSAEVLIGGAVVSTMPSIALDLRRDGGPNGPDAQPMLRVHALAPDGSFVSRSVYVDG